MQLNTISIEITTDKFLNLYVFLFNKSSNLPICYKSMKDILNNFACDQPQLVLKLMSSY